MLKSPLFRVGLAAVTALALVGCGGEPNPADSPDGASPEGDPPESPSSGTDRGGYGSTEGESTSGDESDATLFVSAIPDEKITDQKVKFDKLAEYLSGKLDVPVEFVFSKDYADAVTKFKNGEVHLVWFGGLSGVQARMAVDGAEAIAQGKSDPKYKSYFIANTDTDLKRSEKFPKKIEKMTFTFGSPGSTSGRLMPTYFIMQNNGGTKPEEWFAKEPGFQMSGGHVATANAVADGTYQTGALNYRTYDSLVESEPKIEKNTRIIWVTPLYADYNFTIHPRVTKAFGNDFIEKVREALVAAPAGSDPLKAINREAIIPAENADFQGIKETAVQVGLISN